MSEEKLDPLWAIMSLLFKPHPWHGVLIGDHAPDVVTTYIEMVPTDTVKYEIDKETGFLKVDRPQLYSNLCPAMYGFLPQTFCAEEVAAYCREQTGREGITGDGDPLDILVLSEKHISHGDILLQAVPIGGLRMIDDEEADDKIVAILEGDAMYGTWKDLSDAPDAEINRLKHYFLTYKDLPGANKPRRCEITHVYGRDEAHEVIRRSQADYLTHFKGMDTLLAAAMRHE